MEKKALFLVNPYAGRQRIKNELVNVLDSLTKANYETVVITTQGKDRTPQLLEDMENRFELLICSGGDGTFNEVLSAVMHWDKKPVLGYIPAGSTNDFAAGLSLSTDIRTGIRDIIDGEDHTLDAGKFNDTFFSYVAAFGVFTGTSYKTSQSIKNAIGHFAYILEGIKELPALGMAHHLKISCDEMEIEDDFCFGAISNAKSVGGLLKMKDDLVDLNDGLLEVMLVRRPMTPIDITLIITSLNTMNYDNPMFVTFQTSSLMITSEDDLVWSLDGERVEGGTEARISCIKDAYQIKIRNS